MMQKLQQEYSLGQVHDVKFVIQVFFAAHTVRLWLTSDVKILVLVLFIHPVKKLISLQCH
jgi:hypothetical protein